MRAPPDLTPQSVMRTREAAGRRRALLAVAVVAAIVVVGLYAFLIWQERLAIQAVRQADRELAALGPGAVRLSQLVTEMQQFDTRRQELQVFVGQGRQLSLLLEDISRLIPVRAWLVTMQAEPGALTLAGNALDRVSVAQFSRTLATSRVLDQVQLRTLQQSGETPATQFQMTARLKQSQQ
jgi:Tfp pilus assembly protein PilN